MAIKEWKLEFQSMTIHLFEVIGQVPALIVEHQKNMESPPSIRALDRLKLFLYAEAQGCPRTSSCGAPHQDFCDPIGRVAVP